MTPDLPEIPGFDVECSPDGTVWIARLQGTLTPRQAAYGCQTQVAADSHGELAVLCCAEQVKAAIIDSAERLANRCCDQKADDGA